jgi:hypothetical protein
MHQLDLALEKMPLTFSSNKYSKKCQQLGIGKDLIAGGTLATYLHKNCEQLNSRRTWRKKAVIIKTNTNLEQAIALVKSHGLKVSKQVTDWVEI